MTAAEFEQRFPDITVGLNWERFAAEAWPVEHRVLTSRDELLEFYTFFRRSLWRIMPHFLHWLRARQMRMAHVLDNFAAIPVEHRVSIENFASRWAGEAAEIVLELPSYKFGQNQHYILDANHRACAVALSGRPFRIELYSVVGPRERSALPDVVACR